MATLWSVSQKGSGHLKGRWTNKLHEEGGNIRTTLENGINGRIQISICFLFENVAVHADFLSLIEIVLLMVHRQDQNFDHRIPLFDYFGSFQPLEARHGNIQDHHIWWRWISALQLFQEFHPVSGFTDHLQIGVFLNNPPEALPH